MFFDVVGQSGPRRTRTLVTKLSCSDAVKYRRSRKLWKKSHQRRYNKTPLSINMASPESFWWCYSPADRQRQSQPPQHGIMSRSWQAIICGSAQRKVEKVLPFSSNRPAGVRRSLQQRTDAVSRFTLWVPSWTGGSALTPGRAGSHFMDDGAGMNPHDGDNDCTVPGIFIVSAST